MKKRFLAFGFIVCVLTCNCFAKSLHIPNPKSKETLIVYKVVINRDIDRDFYSKTLKLTKSVDNPHTSGNAFCKYKKLPFRSFNLKKYKIELPVSTQPVGEFTASLVNKEVDSFLPELYLFGEEYKIVLPVSSDYTGKIVYDTKENYVYLGTFVYDMFDGNLVPVLTDIVDEYEEAQQWLINSGKKKAILSRAEIQQK